MPSRSKGKDRQADHDRHERHQHVSGPRPFWSGSIAFGLVNLPVGLFPANRSKPLTLHMVDDDGTPLSRRYFCEREQRPLKASEIVRGYEVDKGEFVVVEDDELESLAPERSQEIDLKRFVAVDEIDPMYFERAYFLTPDRGATKAYRLLARSMEDAGRAGIATFVMRDKEYLVAIIAEKGILRAETLRFDDELRTPEDAGLPALDKPAAAEVRHLERAIEAHSGATLDRARLEDEQSQRILALIRAKLARGEDVLAAPQPDEEEEGGEVIDLMQVLKQSLEQGQTPGGETHPAARKRSGRDEGTGKASAKRRRQPTRSELERASKSELYARAKALDIAGRSAMNKEELIAALAKAQ